VCPQIFAIFTTWLKRIDAGVQLASTGIHSAWTKATLWWRTYRQHGSTPSWSTALNNRGHIRPTRAGLIHGHWYGQSIHSYNSWLIQVDAVVKQRWLSMTSIRLGVLHFFCPWNYAWPWLIIFCNYMHVIFLRESSYANYNGFYPKYRAFCYRVLISAAVYIWPCHCAIMRGHNWAYPVNGDLLNWAWELRIICLFYEWNCYWPRLTQ